MRFGSFAVCFGQYLRLASAHTLCSSRSGDREYREKEREARERERERDREKDRDELKKEREKSSAEKGKTPEEARLLAKIHQMQNDARERDMDMKVGGIPLSRLHLYFFFFLPLIFILFFPLGVASGPERGGAASEAAAGRPAGRRR